MISKTRLQKKLIKLYLTRKHGTVTPSAWREGYECALRKVFDVLDAEKDTKLRNVDWIRFDEVKPEDVCDYNKHVMKPTISCVVTTRGNHRVTCLNRRAIRKGELFGKATLSSPIVEWEWVGHGFEPDVLAWCQIEPYYDRTVNTINRRGIYNGAEVIKDYGKRKVYRTKK